MNTKSSGTECIAPQRIITPLAPKRVPSVAPGLEGLAAMAPDSCEAAPEAMASIPEFVVSAIEVASAECPEPQIVVGHLAITGELPELVTCELLPPDGEARSVVDSESLVVGSDPFELGAAISHGNVVVSAANIDGIESTLWNDLDQSMVTKLGKGWVSSIDSGDYAIAAYAIDGDISFINLITSIDLGAAGLDCHESEDPQALLSDYKAFLADTPGWVEKFSQPSQYFGDLVFGTDDEATNFDNWFIEEISPDGVEDHHNAKSLLAQFKKYAAQNDLHEYLLESYYFEELDFRTPAEAQAFDSWYEDYHYYADIVADYKAFLADTPGWVEKFSQPSQYFGDLVFGTDDEAIDFDNWFIEEVSPDGVQDHHDLQAPLAQFKTSAAQNDLHDYLLDNNYLGIDFRTPAEARAFDWWYSGFYENADVISHYKTFLADTPGWVEQFSQPSAYFGDLIFGTSEEAADFDAWFIEEVSPEGVQNHHNPQSLLAQFKTYAAQNDFYDHLTMSNHVYYLDFRTPAEALAFDAWYEEFEQPEELPLMSGDADQGNWSLGNISAISSNHIDGDKVTVTALGKNVTFDIDLGGATNNADIANISFAGYSSLSVVVNPIDQMNIGLRSLNFLDSGTVSDGVLSLRPLEFDAVLVGKFDDADDNEVILELVDDRPPTEQIQSNTLTISNSPDVSLQGGEIVPGESMDAFNPNTVHADIQLLAEGGASLLPYEILTNNAPGFADALTSSDAAAGLAPTLGAVLVVEFDVLSPSKQFPDQLAETCAGLAVPADVPLVVAADADSCRTSLVSFGPLPDVAQPSVSGQYEGSCGMPNLNATNVAAAVATGIAAQGSGVAPSMRRPWAKV